MINHSIDTFTNAGIPYTAYGSHRYSEIPLPPLEPQPPTSPFFFHLPILHPIELAFPVPPPPFSILGVLVLLTDPPAVQVYEILVFHFREVMPKKSGPDRRSLISPSIGTAPFACGSWCRAYLQVRTHTIAAFINGIYCMHSDILFLF